MRRSGSISMTVLVVRYGKNNDPGRARIDMPNLEPSDNG